MSKITLLPLAGALIIGASALTSITAAAGPGHDHDHAAAPAKAAPASPRIIAVSENYELVGILKEGKLTIYLDRRHDTSPVKDARIEMTIDDVAGTAQPTKDGTYEFQNSVLSKHGPKEVIITLADGDQNDLLVGTLAEDHSHGHNGTHGSHNHAGHTHSGHEPRDNSSDHTLVTQLSNPMVVGSLALAIGLLLGAFVRRRATTTVLISFLIVIVGTSLAWAGPGHDHGHGHDTSSSATNGDAPRRLPDGSLFLPKPTQRLLEIRTRILTPTTARTTQTLIGRVISDPNRSGLVQSTIGGRIKVASKGLPVLGQKIRAGDILAYVEPAFEAIDASDVGQTAGDLEQRMAVLEARIARQERLVKKGVVNKASLEDLSIELAGLKARRAQLDRSRREPEALVAPVDGEIAEVHVVAGQVVTSAITLFHIVDPTSFFVEAIAFDPRLAQKAASAHAQTPDGDSLKLGYVGHSRALQQQAAVLQFQIDNPPPTLSIGTPIKVLVDTGEPVNGLIVPRDAIARAPNGQTVAFKRMAPEIYRPAPVRVEVLDAKRMRVIAGLVAGEQVIVRNAPLVNQIR